MHGHDQIGSRPLWVALAGSTGFSGYQKFKGKAAIVQGNERTERSLISRWISTP